MKQLNKTRKNKIKGGVISKLPLSLNININNFSDKWNIFYIGAHGILDPNIKFKIPNDTYILHIAPSGKGCGQDDSILNQIVYDDKSMSSVISKNKFWKNIFNFLSLKNPEATGFKSIIYNDKMNKNYKNSDTIGFYEPGDECHELYFNFNTSPPLYFFETGLYKLPMKKSYLDYVNDHQEKISEGFQSKMSIDEINKLYKEGDKFFHTRNDNLLSPQLKINSNYLFKLSDILNISHFIEIGKKRIFIIFACRIVSTNDVKNTIKVRRHSINLRKYNK